MMNPRSFSPVTAIKPSLKVPAVMLALSLVLGNVAGKYADGKEDIWLTGFLPVMGILAFASPTPVGLFGAGFAAGNAVSCLKNFFLDEEPDINGRHLTLYGKVLKISPGIHGNTDLLIGVTETQSLRKGKVRFSMNVSIKGKDSTALGDRIRMRAALKKTFKNRMFGKIVYGRLAGDDLVVDHDPFFTLKGTRKRLDYVFSSKEDTVTGLLAALALGQRWKINRFMQNVLRKTGTCHLMAISGVHVGSALVIPFIFAQVILSGFLKDGVGWKRALPMIGGLMTLTLYLSLTGLSTSATRACLFTILYWAAMVSGRYPHVFTILGWCVALIVCFSSGSQPDVALFLSASAVTGIIMASTHPCGPVLKALQVTVGAVLFTLPLSVWFSGGISVVALICNLLAGLVFGFALIPLAVLIDLLACVASPGELLVAVWIRLAIPLMAVLEWFSELPLAFLVLSQTGCLVAAIVSAIALVIWTKVDFQLRAGIFLFLAVVITAGTFEKTREWFLMGETVLCFPRVGQADAAILKGGGRTVLIDCAAAGRPGCRTSLEKQLVKMGVTRIDGLFLTHAHPDHIGGFQDIMKRWKIDVLYLPEFEKDPGRWPEVIKSPEMSVRTVSLKEEDKISIGPFKITVLGPPVAGWKGNGENARSLQLSVAWNDMTALFTGDAPWEQVITSLEKMTQLELIKIPHHGSQAGFPPDGLASILSRLSGKNRVTAVFPSPPPGTTALPSWDVVEWFEKRGVKCLFTGKETGLIFGSREILRVTEFWKNVF